MIRWLKPAAMAFFGILLVCHSAFAMQADISPQKLFPGDSFVVRLSGEMPEAGVKAFIGSQAIPMSGCGEKCLLGIGVVDPDTKPGDAVVSLQAGTEQLYFSISVMKADYPEHHITLPEKQVVLDPQDLARAKKEAERLKEIWKLDTARLFQGGFIMPLKNPVSASYGSRRIFNNETVSIHWGIDIRGSKGEEVLASNSGRVVLSEELFFGGNTVIIDHGMGIFTIYMHLDRFAVRSGDTVKKGCVIGYVGSTGRSTGPHLHFGVKISTINANPISLIKLQLDQDQ